MWHEGSWLSGAAAGTAGRELGRDELALDMSRRSEAPPGPGEILRANTSMRARSQTTDAAGRRWNPEQLSAFYRRVGTGHPRRHRIRGVGFALGWAGWSVLWVVAGAAWGAGFVLGVAVIAVALSRLRREVFRTGGLRWLHRGNGAIEVELLAGGDCWRRDLIDVASVSLAFEDRDWRSFEVQMVTAVFPARWLQAWGFEVAHCSPWVGFFYRFVYCAIWMRWCLTSWMSGSPRPRFRRRSCVEARHRMGRWMDVVISLPPGLRRPRRAEFLD